MEKKKLVDNKRKVARLKKNEGVGGGNTEKPDNREPLFVRYLLKGRWTTWKGRERERNRMPNMGTT